MTRSSWLPRDTSVASAFERRSARAELLSKSASEAAVLRFAAGVYRAQAGVAAELEERLAAGGASRKASSGLADDLPAITKALEPLVRFAGKEGPPGLRAAVDAYRTAGAARLLEWWQTSRTGRVDYLARLLLRPYAELLAARGIVAEPMRRGSSVGTPASTRAHACACGGLPWIGWRKSGAGDEAAARYLGCGVCGRERQISRIACAACGEAAPDLLAVYHTEQHPAVRLEACDRCQRYLKSIDLTSDGLIIPEVDDLASLSLDLWAVEQGYERLEPSLAGG
jgi:formate dehydrogenase accessory protein FdhE